MLVQYDNRTHSAYFQKKTFCACLAKNSDYKLLNTNTFLYCISSNCDIDLLLLVNRTINKPFNCKLLKLIICISSS